MNQPAAAKPIEIVQAMFGAFRAKDVEGIRRVMHPDIEWIQNAGFPGGHWRGVDDVLGNAFTRLRTEWTDWRADITEWLEAGDAVVAIGVYRATHDVTGKAMEAAFAHVYDVRDGRVVRMRQFTDTLMVERATRPG